MNQQILRNLTPELKLKLFLMENDYPYNDIPKLLAYCPQLLNRFTIEEIGLACLTEVSTFKPKSTIVKIRPFIYSAAKHEVGDHSLVPSFIEQSIAIFASDTLEITFTELINNILVSKGLR
jgi:hypothetical protein